MPLTIPPELKKITPYVRRAEELDKDKANAESRLVAYYCRQYAVHTGITLATSAAGKTCLGELLSSLEEEKAAMDAFTRDEAKFLCRKFADKIFDKADLEDRTGAANKNTAKTFYAAASFLEILQQFYKEEESSEEMDEIKKRAVYAKWKATDILKAIKEGREPTPGGYGEDIDSGENEATTEDAPEGGTTDAPATGKENDTPAVETVSEEEETSDPVAPVVRLPSTEQPAPKEEESKDEGTEVELGPPPSYDFAPPPVAPPAAPVNKPPLTFSPPPAAPPMPAPPAAKPAPPPEKKSGFLGFGKKKNKNKLSKAEFADAIELTKFALAALEDKNAELAAERLKQALEVVRR